MCFGLLGLYKYPAVDVMTISLHKSDIESLETNLPPLKAPFGQPCGFKVSCVAPGFYSNAIRRQPSGYLTPNSVMP